MADRDDAGLDSPRERREYLSRLLSETGEPGALNCLYDRRGFNDGSLELSRDERLPKGASNLLLNFLDDRISSL